MPVFTNDVLDRVLLNFITSTVLGLFVIFGFEDDNELFL